jgi:hypothetical protein
MSIKINNKTDVNQISLGEIVIVESKGEGTESVSIKAPSLATSLNLVLPNSNGTNGQVLSTDGSGNLSWSSSSSSGVSSIIAGTGISVDVATGAVTVTNSDPDQTVSLNNGTGISVTGTYPNFTIASTITQYTNSDARNSLSSTATGLTYTSGTGVFSLTSGYSIPSTSSQSNWDTAYTNRITSLTVTSSSGAATLVSNVLNIPTYTLSGLGGQASSTNLTSLSNLTYASSSFVKMTSAGTFSLDTTSYGTGTVTSVAALTLGTTGTDLSSTVATGTTTPVITLNVPTASATNRGALSSSDFTNFNTAYTNRITSLTVTGSSGAATLTSNTLNIPTYTLAGLGGISLTSLSTTITGITYTNTTGVFSITAGYGIPTTSSQTNWDTAYTNRITSLTTTGSGAATLVSNVLNIPTPSAATFTSLTVTGSSGASTLSSGILNVPTYTLAGLGGIKLTDLSSTATGLTYTNTTGVFSATSGYAIPTTTKQTNWDTAYTQTQQWNGGSTNLVASTGRTSLGATTVGSNLFTLTNPSAVTFPRFNLDNTVSALDAATFRTAIGAGTSSTSGTVTSVAALTLGTTGTDVSSTVATGTTTPVITLNIPTASATNRGALSSSDFTNFNTAYTNRITSLTTTGSSGSATLTTNTLNIPAYTLSGLGGQASSTNLTSLSGLTYVSASFVKMTASGTFSLDTNSYVTTSGNAATATSATTATNLAGGGAGQLPYNTGSGATSFLAAGTTAQHLRSNGTSAPTWEVQGFFSGGRLTLESGVPVSSTDQTAKTTIYYTPYNGSVISIYNGTSWGSYSFSELSLTTSGLAANSNYDIFAYVSGSTVTLEYSAAWTNDTTRSSALSLLNGVYVKSSDNTRRYLGSIRSNASTQFTDSQANRLVWNFNNRVLRCMSVIAYTGSHTYNGGAREWNGGTSVTRLYFITGISGDTFLANGSYSITSGGFSCNAWFGVDSTTTQFGNSTTDDRAAVFTRRAMTSIGQVNFGYHYLTAIQSTESAGTSTYLDVVSGGTLLC